MPEETGHSHVPTLNMNNDVIQPVDENLQATPDLFQKYQAYVMQRQDAVAAMQDETWQLQEPPAFDDFEAFAQYWEYQVSPLMRADFARYLEGGWEKVRQEVEKLVVDARQGAEDLMKVAVVPTPELYAKYVAFWTASNNSEDANEFNASPVRIDSFELFVLTWLKIHPAGQKCMAKWFEDGYEVTSTKSIESAHLALAFNEFTVQSDENVLVATFKKKRI